MVRTTVVKTGKLLFLLLILAWCIPQAAAYIVLRQGWLQAQARQAIQRGLVDQYGLSCEIESLKTGPGLGFELTGLTIADRRRPDRPRVVRVAHAYIRFSGLRFLLNARHPEAALTDILLDRPELTLTRDANGAWLWARFMTGDKERPAWRPTIRIHDARIIAPDPLLPHPTGRLSIPEATLDLRSYPRLRVWTILRTDLDPALVVRAKIEYDLDRAGGWAQLSWQNASPGRWQNAGWLPADQLAFVRGRSKGEARLALGAKIGLTEASASLEGGLIRVNREGWPSLAVEGQATMRERTLQFTGVSIKAGEASLTGKARLTLDRPDPMVEADLRVAAPDLAAASRLFVMPGGLSVDGRLRGTVRVNGRLADPRFSGNLSVADGELTYPSLPPVKRIGFRAKLADKTLLFEEFRAEVAEAGISGRGRLAIYPAPELDMELAGKDLALAPLLAACGQPGWLGRVDLRQAHLTVAFGRFGIQASAAWRGAAWRKKALPDGSGDITGESGPGGLALTAAGAIGSGRFKADTQYREGGWQGNARLDRVGLAPLGGFLPPGYQDLAGKATADLALRGSAAEPVVLFAGLVANPRLAGRAFDEFKGSLRWQGTKVIVETGQVTLGEASATMQGQVDWARRDLDLNLTVHRLPLALLDPEAAGLADGRLALAGKWPEALAGQGRMSLDDLSWMGTPLGTADLEFTLAGGRVAIRRGHLASQAGEADLAGGFSLSGERQLALDVTKFNWDARSLGRLLPGRADLRGRLSGQIQVLGTLQAPVARGHLEIGPGGAYGFEWQAAAADLRWQERLLIEKGLVRAAGAEITAAGGVGPAGWDLNVQAKRADLATVLAALPYRIPWPISGSAGSIGLNGRVTGPLAKPVIAGDLAGDQVRLGKLACDRVEGRLRLEGQVVTLTGVEARSGERSYAATGWIDLSRQTLDLDLQVARGDLSALLGLANLRTPWPVRGFVTGRGKLNGGLTDPAFAGDLRVEDGSAGEVPFAGEVRGSYDKKVLSCRSLRLAYDGGELTASGRLSPKELQLELAASGLPLRDLASLAGKQEMIRGRGDLILNLRREGSSARGDFRLEVEPGAVVAEIPVDRVLLEGSIKDRNVNLTRGELVTRGHNLMASGRLPLPQGLGLLEELLRDVPPSRDRLGLKLEGSGLPVVLFNPALDDLAVFAGGELDIGASLAGTWATPVMDGRIVLRNASGKTSLLPEPFSALQAEVELSGQNLVLRKATAKFGAGWGELGGTVGLAGGKPRYDLQLKAGSLAYKNPEFIDGVASNLDLTITGGPMPIVAGVINIREARITVGPSTHSPPPPPVGLDIRLVAKRDVKFFLPGVADIPLAGELQLRGTLAAPALSGVVDASRGFVFVYGERFDVTQAAGTFTYDRGYLPHVELQGSKTIRDVKVFVKVHGEIAESGLTINLWSDPPRTAQQILALLPAGGGLSGTGHFLVGGLEMALETVFGQVTEDVRRLINADRLQFTTDDQTGAFSLQLGKYVFDDLYVSYKILFDQFSTRVWTFDYNLNSYLVLSGVFSNTEQARWTLSYQIRF